MSARSDLRTRSETIGSDSGLRITIVEIGACIESILVPTSRGLINAVVSHSDPASYGTGSFYLGSTVGPVANRIHGASFTLDGIQYHLDANETERGNCLHGGTNGLHKEKFSLARDESNSTIKCRTDLADGFGGFPGNRSFEVAYELLDEWSLAIDFNVTTDRDTVINLANHSYFNL